LAGLVESGVCGNLSTINPPLSPMLWTSIATGKRAWKHGVHGFSEVDPLRGTVRPISATARTCKAVWNILHQCGKSCHVYGWWPSQPVEPLRGCMVSNHFHQAVAPVDQPWPRLPGSAHPPEMHDAFDALRIHPLTLDGDVLRHFVPRAPEIDQQQDRRLLTVAKILAECSTIQAVATHGLSERPDWDFAAVYFDAIDHFSHAFMAYHPPRLPWVPEWDFELYQEVVRAGYVYHDIMLGVLRQLAGPETTVIVMSDHGFHPDHLRPRVLPNEPAGPAAEHGPFGIFVAAGPGLRRDEAVTGGTILDITPTILSLFGLPVGRDMDGLVMTGIFAEPPEITYIDSWETLEGDAARLTPETGNLPTDPAHTMEALRQLEDLGYIEAGHANNDHAAAATVRELQFNLARARDDGGESARAREIYASLWESWPDESRFGLHLLLAQLASRQPIEARQTLTLLRERKARAMENAAAERDALLARLRLDPPGDSADEAWIEALGDPDRRKLRTLQRRSQLNPLAFDFLEGSLLTLEGRPREAIPFLERAANSQKGNRISALLALAEACTCLRETEGARAHLIEILDLDPTHAVAHFRLARLDLAEARWRPAAEHATRALALRHHFPQAALVAGLAHWRGRDLEAAEQFLRRALALNPVFPAGQAVMAAFCRRELHDPAAAQNHLRLAREARARIRLLESGQRPAHQHAEEFRADFAAGKQSLLTSPLVVNPPTPADPQGCIILVSGLPRSGTSMMMQMLVAGGVPVLTDGARAPDQSNPRGYLEFEKTKTLHRDNSWLAEAAGRAVKIVSPLLGTLPPPTADRHYLVVHLHRPLDEVAQSQQTMLARLARQATKLTPDAQRELLAHQMLGALTTLSHWRTTGRVSVLDVPYHEAVRDPAAIARLVAWFLQPAFSLDATAAARAVSADLHWERLVPER
jgi:predicted AlkP superfamily phosphohydrolase/phosphomutase/tetratricopeptide (TPR) repeat protein